VYRSVFVRVRSRGAAGDYGAALSYGQAFKLAALECSLSISVFGFYTCSISIAGALLQQVSYGQVFKTAASGSLVVFERSRPRTLSFFVLDLGTVGSQALSYGEAFKPASVQMEDGRKEKGCSVTAARAPPLNSFVRRAKLPLLQ
jgi:hypothetical protein